MLRLHSNSFRILDSLWSPIKREVRPEELKNRSQDTQHAALIQELMSKKNFDQKKQAIAQHLADLRKRGVLKDVSSELGFYTKQSVSEVDDASVHTLIYSSMQSIQSVCPNQRVNAECHRQRVLNICARACMHPNRLVRTRRT
jgi:hypothetical protein